MFDCTEECDVLTVDDWFCIIRPLKKWMLARLWFGKYFCGLLKNGDWNMSVDALEWRWLKN